MARGRIINNKISDNIDFNISLSSDTCRMFFMMLISHLDVEGRIQGEPGYLASKIVPWRNDIDNIKVEEFLKEYSNLGFIKWYEIDGNKYIWFPSFDNNQPNLRKDRETPSNIPEFQPEYEISSGKMTESFRQNDGMIPQNCHPKLKEDKLNKENKKIKEEKEKIHTSLCFEFYKIYNDKTVQFKRPSEDDFKKSFDYFKNSKDKNKTYEQSKKAIEFYFSEEWWFTFDKKTKKMCYSFGGFVAHIGEIITWMNEKYGKGKINKQDYSSYKEKRK